MRLQIDEEYRQLCMDLGLVSMPARGKYVVYVADMSKLDRDELFPMSGAIGIDRSLLTRQTRGGPVDSAQLLHDALFGQIARSTFDQMVSSRIDETVGILLDGHFTR
jgi:hypothetical protein